MATLNLSTNGPSIKSSYQGVVNSPAPSGPAASSPTYAQWAMFSVSAPLVSAFQQDGGGKESVLKVQSTGEGELVDLIEDFSEGRIQFAFVKVKDPNTTLPKYVLIGWCGEGVPERTKGYFTSHLAAVSKMLHGYHVQITARSDRDLTPESIVQKVADSSGSKYSAGNAPPPSSGPAPPISSRPAFMPTSSGTGSGFNPLASSRSRQGGQDGHFDDDGWAADAPPVTRTQLEKVQSAYQPTKVNMAELTKQRPEPSQFNGSSRTDNGSDIGDIAKGGYQPIGKVDIAAIRAQAQKRSDDRPTIVKGAYEPVGKVDIAAIRAKAQKPTDDGPRQALPIASGASAGSSGDNQPKSLAARSAAFTQSERLTSLPKPKPANKFGSNTSSFTGTKAPKPGVFGLQSAPPTAASAPVGAASRTFADKGGKTPAQIWAEKKARERGLSGVAQTTGPGAASPITSQTSGGGEWKSGYTGKSWAPVATTTTGRSGTGSVGEQRTGEQDREQDDAPNSPTGGIGALRDRFKGAAPMGAPTIQRATTDDQTPPPLDTASKPIGGIAMPGLPTRPRQVQDEDRDEDEDRGPNVPPRRYPAEDEERDSGPNIPPPPRVQRSPTPPSPEERDTSPVRIAMPVSRGKETVIEPPEERLPLPAMPIRSMAEHVPDEEELTEEPAGHDPARGAGIAVAEASFGQDVGNEGPSAKGKRAIVQYDYEKAEDNEVELAEGETVVDIDMLDPDWYAGTNSKGERGLFPANYVEILPIATALYDYEAAEDNELSFKEGSKITALEFPSEEWFFGHYEGQQGLFPANYVQIEE